MTYRTPTALKAVFDTIRNETVAGANTEARVADAYQDASHSTICTVDGYDEAITAVGLSEEWRTISIRYLDAEGDGGGGTFDRVPVGSYTSDNRNVIAGSTYAWIRRAAFESASASSTLLVNGNNASVAVPVASIVHVTGPTALVTIQGLDVAPHGTCRMFELAYNYDTVVEYNSSSAAAGEKLLTPSGADLTLYAPGANGYNTLTVRYDEDALSGAGAWRVIGYIGGA